MGVIPAIEIATQSIQYIDEEVKQKAATIVNDEVLQPIDTQVKLLSSRFLNSLNRAELELQNLEVILKEQQELRKVLTEEERATSTVTLAKQYRLNKIAMKTLFASNSIDNLFKEFLFFQTELNAIINQKIEVVFVVDNVNTPPSLLTSQNVGSLLKYQESNNAVSARFNLTEEEIQNLRQLDLFTDEDDLSGLEDAQATYSKFYNLRTMRKTSNGRVGGGITKYVMWRKPIWTKQKVLNLGDLHEAYANIVIQRYYSIFERNGASDDNMDRFAYFLQQVDNAFGLLQGDIDLNNIQYAIKSINSALTGIKQTKEVALALLSMRDVSVENILGIKKLFAANASTRNKIEQGQLQVDVEKEISKLNIADTYQVVLNKHV